MYFIKTTLIQTSQKDHEQIQDLDQTFKQKTEVKAQFSKHEDQLTSTSQSNIYLH